MEVYARELLDQLAAVAGGIRITAFVSEEGLASIRGGAWRLPGQVEVVGTGMRSTSRIQWVLGDQVVVPRLARSAGVDLLHSLGSTAPARGRFKRVVTVHDLIYARFPQAHAGLLRFGMRVLVPFAARSSDRVQVPSESTKRDLVELLGVDPARIDVIPEGVRPPAAPAAGRDKQEFGLDGRPVVLALSAKRPHKNLERLLEALALLPPERRPQLVLPGYATWHEEELQGRIASLGLERDVRIVGWLDEAALERLWACADCFIHPALYEGFGLPVLEAMARGVPVACSRAASLPEVAGDAALLFDPRDVHGIARAIERLLADGALAERLREQGLARAQRFTWRRTAELALASYARALGLDAVPDGWVACSVQLGLSKGAG